MATSNNSFLRNINRGVLYNVKRIFLKPPKKVIVNWLMQKYYKHLPDDGSVRKFKLLGKYLYYCSIPELLHGLQEIFDEHIYKQQLEHNPYIIDCGANIGMSVIYMKSLYPAAEIIAFEPDDNNFDLLEKNIKSFGLSGIELRKEAVWNANTTLLFSNESSMGSKIATDKTLGTVEVKAIRLKDFLNKPVDFLKIDIEGAEYEVVTDIADNLHYVKNMFLEYHGSFSQNAELVKMMDIVNKAGFNFYIKEASPNYPSPFDKIRIPNVIYDVQLNIFCFRD